MKGERINLSSPVITNNDIDGLTESLNLNDGINTLGCIKNFESKLSEFYNAKSVIAVSSGTAALHLSLLALNVKPNEKVIIPSLTFAASAYAVEYLQAQPVFMDVDSKSWTMDLDLLEAYLSGSKVSELPKVIMNVDLFGRTCDLEQLGRIAQKYDLKVLSDSAESLGTKYQNKTYTNYSDFSIVSFNNNKIITALGGGAVYFNDVNFEERIRKLANQSREKVHWYEHLEIGYNYRISPLQATLGETQLSRIEQILNLKLKIYSRYVENFDGVPGVKIIEDSPWEQSNKWLICAQFSDNKMPGIKDKVFTHLNNLNIESRFVWKPLHLQPIFSHKTKFLNGSSERIFKEGLCLPSSINLTMKDIDKVSQEIIKVVKLYS